MPNLSTAKNESLQTQGDVFGQSLGGFKYGRALPAKPGDISGFQISEIAVECNDSAAALGDKILKGFGVKLERAKYRRARQLRETFDWLIDGGWRVVILVNDAHHLTRETLYSLKHMREWTTGFKASSPGIILLGIEPLIENMLAVERGVAMRTNPLPKFQLIAVDW